MRPHKNVCLSPSTLSGFPSRAGALLLGLFVKLAGVCGHNTLKGFPSLSLSLPQSLFSLSLEASESFFHVNRCDYHPARPTQRRTTRKSGKRRGGKRKLGHGARICASIGAFRTGEGDLLLQLFKCYSRETLGETPLPQPTGNTSKNS